MTDHPGVAGRKQAELPIRPISVSVSVAAQLTGLGSRTIWRWIAEGKIEAVTAGKRRLVLYDSLEQLIRSKSAA